MRRESVPQLTCVSCQVQRDLLQLVYHELPRALVAAELAVGQLLALSHAANDGPHQQVRNVDRHRLRETRELGRVCPDGAGISTSFKR